MRSILSCAQTFDRETSFKASLRGDWAAINSPALILSSRPIISSYHLVDGHARPTTLPRSGRLRQSRLRQAFDDALKISGVLVRQDAFALRQREVRIHFEKLRPRRACVVRAPEMAVAGRQHHASGVGG